MPEIATAFQTAFYMVVAFDPDLMEIVGRSLQVNFAAVGAAILVGLPLGAAIAIFHFPGHVGGRITNINLTTCNIVGSSVQRRGFR